MAQAIERTATYADLEAAPPHLVAEILYGRLVTHPRPTRRHGGATSALSAMLSFPYQFGIGGPGGWIFVDEPELHLGPHVVVPDIAGWRRERVTEPADKAWFEVAPDWLCEVLSPRTEKYDKGDKRRIYAQYEVGHLWHVDPRARMLETFDRQGSTWLVTGTFFDDDKVNAAPFPEATVSLDLLWPFDSAPPNPQV